jgi:hypothetical protein
MLRVQNQAKQDVSSGLSLALVVSRGDHQVARIPDQSKIHRPLDCSHVSQGSLSTNEIHELRQEQQGKVKAGDNFTNNNAYKARQKFPYNYLT